MRKGGGRRRDRQRKIWLDNIKEWYRMESSDFMGADEDRPSCQRLTRTAAPLSHFYEHFGQKNQVGGMRYSLCEKTGDTFQIGRPLSLFLSILAREEFFSSWSSFIMWSRSWNCISIIKCCYYYNIALVLQIVTSWVKTRKLIRFSSESNTCIHDNSMRMCSMIHWSLV